MRTRKTYLSAVLIIALTATLTACGSGTPTPQGAINNSGANSGGCAGSNAVSNNTSPKTTKLDSDIMEYYAINLYDRSENDFERDDHGNIVRVYLAGREGNDKKPYLEMTYDSSGRVSEIYEHSKSSPVLVISFIRNDKGQKTETNTQTSDNKGGLKPAAHIVTEYDSSGRRTIDYPYTADGKPQESYTEYQYDSQGRRVGIQKKDSNTKAVLSNEVYEYDSDGRLSNAYSYSNGAFVSRKEYIYGAKGFDHMVVYAKKDAKTGDILPQLLLPNTLYEVLDY